MTVKAIPDDYPRLSPYLIVDGASDAIAWYQKIFGAEERLRMGAPGGQVGHAELQIGSGLLMIADEYPDMGSVGPKTVGGSPVFISLYVNDVDAVHDAAVAAGAKSTRPVEDQFYGDRACEIQDPWGHRWHLATHIEDMTHEEMQRRAEKMFGG